MWPELTELVQRLVKGHTARAELATTIKAREAQTEWVV